jgi:hypothetical protein
MPALDGDHLDISMLRRGCGTGRVQSERIEEDNHYLRSAIELRSTGYTFLRLRTKSQTSDFPTTLAKWFFENSLVDSKGLEFYHRDWEFLRMLGQNPSSSAIKVKPALQLERLPTFPRAQPSTSGAPAHQQCSSSATVSRSSLCGFAMPAVRGDLLTISRLLNFSAHFFALARAYSRCAPPPPLVT